MDTDLQATLSAELTQFGADALDLIGVILPIGIGVAISITLVVVGIRWFRRLAGI